MKDDDGLRQRLRTLISPLNSVDKSLTHKLSVCSQQSCSKWRKYMKALEISCHGIPWIGGCLIILWCTEGSFTREVIFNILVALVLDIVLVAIVKAFVRRQRPSNNSDDMFATIGIDNYAFPSGHASRATMIALLFYAKDILGAFASWVITTWAISVGVSRVLMGRHHVGDVIAGVGLGIVESKLMEHLWFDSASTNGILQFFFQFESFHASDA